MELRHGHHLPEDEAFDVDVARLGFEHRPQALEREPDGVDAEPGPRRVRRAPS